MKFSEYREHPETKALEYAMRLVSEAYEFLEKPKEFFSAIKYVRDEQLRWLKLVEKE